MKKSREILPRTILSWAEEDRPREKLILKGKSALSDAELIAILLGSGTLHFSAVDLAKMILNLANNNIAELSRLSIQDLTKLKGVGDAKAITLIAALELGRRRRETEGPHKRKIRSSYDVYLEIKPELMDKSHEEMWLLLLNRSHVVIKKVQMSVGGVSGTHIDIKSIFKHAIENLASSIVLIHNHPSGSLLPSEADRVLTQKLAATGEVMDIKVLDHLIYTDQAYYSFKDENEL